jgi:hypothetical protein
MVPEYNPRTLRSDTEPPRLARPFWVVDLRRVGQSPSEFKATSGITDEPDLEFMVVPYA